MFVLSVISGPTKGQAIRLTSGAHITFGRGSEAGYRFDDPDLADVHAEVSWTEMGFSVLDLSTVTGTFVNGTRVRGRHGLRIGDHVQLGQVILQLKEVAAHETHPPEGPKPVSKPPEKKIAPDEAPTVHMSSAKILAFKAALTERQQKPELAPRLPSIGGDTIQLAPASVESPTLHGYVVSRAKALRALVSSPASVGNAKVFVSRDERLDPFSTVPVSIGREQTNAIVLDDPSISARHAVIDLRGGKYYLRDNGSSNGSFVEGVRVVEHEIKDGDVLHLGSHNLVAVLGTVCLGLEVQAPSLLGRAVQPRTETKIGVVGEPLTTKKKKKKKASELVWYATSDLDKGVFRARAAFVALLLGVLATGWMLARGDSEVLAGSRLSSPHENEDFLAQAESRGRDRCTACHIGVGRVSTMKCLDCHDNLRPSAGHAQAEIECVGCHLEHRGATFRSSPVAARACSDCHATPHERMIREKPKLVVGFNIDTPADAQFHLNHQSRGIDCLKCHGAGVQTKDRGVRGACRQCHAPDHVTAEDCRLCHRAHPDRNEELDLNLVAAVAPPRFQLKAMGGAMGLLVVSFLLAALIPRKRKVSFDKPGDASEE